MKRFKGRFVLLLYMVFMAGCAVHQNHLNQGTNEVSPLNENSSDQNIGTANSSKATDSPVIEELKDPAIVNRLESFEKMIVNNAPETSPVNGQTHRKEIQKWINYFTERDSSRFQRYLDRGQIYKDVIQTLLNDNDLHPDLFYLGLIESGYSTHARSRARAVGAWQFIKSTAKRYDLEVNYYVDERKDPIRSTDAASKYLTDLFNVFHSWELAMSAYNCGEYRVLQAIMRGKTRDFWELSDKKLLPPETRNYVPKLIAAVLIGRDPESFGLRIPVVENEFPSIEAVGVPGPIKLSHVSKEIDIPLSLLKRINPHLTQGMTPPHLPLYEVWVPEGKKGSLVESQKKLAELRVKKRQYWSQSDINSYKVRRGDNLHVLARRFRVSVNFLKRINRLRSNIIYPGQKLRIASRSYKKKRNDPRVQYVYVKRGDSLSSIAVRYGVSISELKKLNNLRSTRIFVGQKLDIKKKKVSSKSYIVKRGDSLGKISRIYGVSIHKLKKINYLKNSRIYVGQEIILR